MPNKSRVFEAAGLETRLREAWPGQSARSLVFLVSGEAV